MKFKVAQEFFDKVPDAVFAVVVVANFDNQQTDSYVEKLLGQNYQKLLSEIKGQNIKEHPAILPYREAFRALGVNPNKFKCSIEAFMTRISKGNPLPHINPAVDLGNALSLKYMLPIGVHDVERFQGDIELRPAIVGDEFTPFGSNTVEHPDLGEIVYVSGHEVKTRRWTWRQGENSKITPTSQYLFIPIDAFVESRAKAEKAQAELVEILSNHFHLTPIFGIVDRDHPEFEF